MSATPPEEVQSPVRCEDSAGMDGAAEAADEGELAITADAADAGEEASELASSDGTGIKKARMQRPPAQVQQAKVEAAKGKVASCKNKVQNSQIALSKTKDGSITKTKAEDHLVQAHTNLSDAELALLQAEKTFANWTVAQEEKALHEREMADEKESQRFQAAESSKSMTDDCAIGLCEEKLADAHKFDNKSDKVQVVWAHTLSRLRARIHAGEFPVTDDRIDDTFKNRFQKESAFFRLHCQLVQAAAQSGASRDDQDKITWHTTCCTPTFFRFKQQYRAMSVPSYTINGGSAAAGGADSIYSKAVPRRWKGDRRWKELEVISIWA